MALYCKGEKIMSDQTNNQPVQEEPSLSELLQVRRDKRAALREQGQVSVVMTTVEVADNRDAIMTPVAVMDWQGPRLGGRAVG